MVGLVLLKGVTYWKSLGNTGTLEGPIGNIGFWVGRNKVTYNHLQSRGTRREHGVLGGENLAIICRMLYVCIFGC